MNNYNRKTSSDYGFCGKTPSDDTDTFSDYDYDEENYYLSQDKMIGKIIKGYKITDILGSGNFGKVYKGESISGNKSAVAIKVITIKNALLMFGDVNTEAEARKKIIQEIKIMRLCCSHPHILKYLGRYEEEDKIYIITEYMSKGDLMDVIEEMNSQFSIDEVKIIIPQLLSAIEYLNSKLIYHRDIKLDNILLERDSDGNPVIKVADFGGAKEISVGEDIHTLCGTKYYMAPEVAKGAYNPSKSDIWSIGIAIYSLVTGYFPFNVDTGKIIGYWMRNRDPYVLYNLKQDNLDNQLYDLLKKIFVPEAERISLEGIKSHPWIRDHIIDSYIPEQAPIRNIDPYIIDIMENTLGFNASEVFNHIYKNRRSRITAIYRSLEVKYKNIKINDYEYRLLNTRLQSSKSDLRIDIKSINNNKKQRGIMKTFTPDISKRSGMRSPKTPRSPKTFLKEILTDYDKLNNVKKSKDKETNNSNNKLKYNRNRTITHSNNDNCTKDDDNIIIFPLKNKENKKDKKSSRSKIFGIPIGTPKINKKKKMNN